MKALIVVTFILTIRIAICQNIESSKHPIDIAFMQCVNGNFSPNGSTRVCATEAIDEWDKELNKYYALLMKKIRKPEHRTDLKITQLAWIEYKSKEFKNKANMVYGENNSGSMYSALVAIYQMEFIRDRALELKYYYEDYSKDESK